MMTSNKLTLPAATSASATGITTWRRLAEHGGLHGLARRWRERRELRKLLDLDDHMLADIGLARSAIVRALATSPLDTLTADLVRNRL